ncbi:MAG: LysM peptidoglycan-binding domain-containing protein [Chloroflexi bacterium]|nr:LysM peptidoglycan-binding domain-containing protein [Chloroflexota bacterium]
MRCPECQHLIEGAPKTCPECQAELPRPKGRVCQTCGAPVSWRAVRCFMCGAELERSKRPTWRWLLDVGVVAATAGLVVLWFLRPAQPAQSPPASTEQPPPAITAPLVYTQIATATLAPPTSPPTTLPTATLLPVAPPTETATAAPAVVTYTIASGDTLSAIGKLYDVPVDSICQASDLVENAVLRIGQVITVPLDGGRRCR